jgi:hypothetical protein
LFYDNNNPVLSTATAAGEIDQGRPTCAAAQNEDISQKALKIYHVPVFMAVPF